MNGAHQVCKCGCEMVCSAVVSHSLHQHNVAVMAQMSSLLEIAKLVAASSNGIKTALLATVTLPIDLFTALADFKGILGLAADEILVVYDFLNQVAQAIVDDPIRLGSVACHAPYDQPPPASLSFHNN